MAVWPCGAGRPAPHAPRPQRGSLSPQCLYACLPALLEGSPFQTARRGSWCAAPPLPEELRRVVSVYQATLDLLRQLQVHPEIAAQVLAYLFFFSGTLLFNQLLDQGEAGPGARPGDAAPEGAVRGRGPAMGPGHWGRDRSTGTSPQHPRTPGLGRGPQGRIPAAGLDHVPLHLGCGGCHSPCPLPSPSFLLERGPEAGESPWEPEGLTSVL